MSLFPNSFLCVQPPEVSPRLVRPSHSLSHPHPHTSLPCRQHPHPPTSRQCPCDPPTPSSSFTRSSVRKTDTDAHLVLPDPPLPQGSRSDVETDSQPERRKTTW